MKIKIDKKSCVKCGTCVLLASGTFSFNDNYEIIVNEKSKDSVEDIKSAISSCPYNAIKDE